MLTNEVSGPVNVTSPQPARNRELTSALARVLRRPALFPVPAPALRLALGGAADELVLASQRVLPRRLLDGGFEFTLPGIEEALRAALEPDARSRGGTSAPSRTSPTS